MFILCQRCLNIKLVIFGVMSVMVGVKAFYWVKRPLWADEVGTFDHAIFVWSFIAFHPWNKSSHKMVAPPTEYYFCKSVNFIIYSFYVCLFVLPVFAGRSQCWQFGTWLWFSIFCRSVFFINFLRVDAPVLSGSRSRSGLNLSFGTLDFKWLFRSSVFRISGFFNSFLLLFHVVLLAKCMLYVPRENVFIALSFLG